MPVRGELSAGSVDGVWLNVTPSETFSFMAWFS
jgi:hypothetical protein